MTWGFVYLATLLVGLLLAGVTGLLRAAPFRPEHQRLVIPTAEQHLGLASILGRRKILGTGLAAFGLVGLLGSVAKLGNAWAVARVSLGAAAIVALLVAVLRRRTVARLPGEGRVTVVREIPPGGYGQVSFHESGIVMAATSVDGELLPVGSEVEVVDSGKSVITVRRRLQHHDP